MCGIGGYYGEHVDKYLNELSILWLALEQRGGDAAGCAWLADKGVMYCKDEGTPVDMLARVRKEWRGSPYVLLHTRLATGGSPRRAENNHPIVGHGWVVTHNGVIWNDTTIPDKKRVSSCDTEAINYFVNRDGIRKGLSESVFGTVAVALVNYKQEEEWVRLYTNNGQLVFCHLDDGGVAWASGRSYLEAAGFEGEFVEVVDGDLWTLGPGKNPKVESIGDAYEPQDYWLGERSWWDDFHEGEGDLTGPVELKGGGKKWTWKQHTPLGGWR